MARRGILYGVLLGIDRARVAMIVAGFLKKEAFGNIFIIFLFHFNFFLFFFNIF